MTELETIINILEGLKSIHRASKERTWAIDQAIEKIRETETIKTTINNIRKDKTNERE